MPFTEGHKIKGNRKGRPKDPGIVMLREALAQVEVEKKESLILHAVRKAYKSEPVLIAILKKVLPDLKEDPSLKELARTIIMRAENNDRDN